MDGIVGQLAAIRLVNPHATRVGGDDVALDPVVVRRAVEFDALAGIAAERIAVAILDHLT
jgi:hypothetical protein